MQNVTSTLKPHKHSDLIKEYARQLCAGEMKAGWWEWEFLRPNDKRWSSKSEFSPQWDESTLYRFKKTEKHPDSIKINVGDQYQSYDAMLMVLEGYSTGTYSLVIVGINGQYRYGEPSCVGKFYASGVICYKDVSKSLIQKLIESEELVKFWSI